MLQFSNKPYTKLYIVSDKAGWVLDEEAKYLKDIGSTLGYKTRIISKMVWNSSQLVHYTSQFSLLDPSIYKSRNRISIDYFHGKPEHGESYKRCFDMISKHKDKISGIRVSYKKMKGFIESTGINADKVFVVPIGIDTKLFPVQTIESKKAGRERLGIPQNAFVIGSFQKDGMGWDEGYEPKLIKGPDIFLRVINELKKDIPNLWVLLSGPSRGYVKRGLEKIGVPYKHQYLQFYKDISELYDVLDLYLIASREEGGPKACLESMAKGIALVTTNVGQCQDLVESGKNAMMANIEDVEELKNLCIKIAKDNVTRDMLVSNGIATAKNNSYESQIPVWEKYLKKLATY